jgi:tetratricopeptide (TPR) repeat protein
LTKGKVDYAYHFISKYDATSFQKEDDRAYYNLLMTRAAIERGVYPSSDSLINEAIRYYKLTDNRERLACCYYYKGEYYINLKDWSKAIKIMKLAEEQVIQTKNAWLKYKIYYAIGCINQRCGNYQLGVDYAQKALPYVLQTDNWKDIADIYMQIAYNYANLGETDSAAYYTEKMESYIGSVGWRQERLLMEIRDSLHQAKARMNNTVLELQWQFDEQKKEEAHRQQLIWAAVALVFLLFIIMLLVLYIRYRKAKERIVLTEQQMQISNYINEIAQLKSQQADSDTMQQIEELNSRIRELVEQESPRLVKGKLLYDEIRKDGTTSGWSNDDYKCFIDYYKAIDFPAYSRIQKKYAPKTAHNTFFLILYEMGMDDKAVRRIMGITQEAIRSTRYRILQNGKK